MWWKGKNMFFLQVEDSFDSAHFLKGYEGKCRNIHGHRWKILIEVEGEELDKQGFVMNFSKIKMYLKELVSQYDHSLLIERQSMNMEKLEWLKREYYVIELDFIPTAENFARHFYRELKEKITNLSSVTIFETPNNSVKYKE